jgi:very-short-patch-repair endonuclease
MVIHRHKRTSLEQAIYDVLRAFPQLEVREQVRIGKYRCDFLIGRLILEVQGSWTHSRPEDVERDARRAACLQRYGYEVAYITEDEIYGLSPLGLIDHLDTLLRRHEHCVWVHAPR